MNEFQMAYDSARLAGPAAWVWGPEEGYAVAYCPHTDGIITSFPVDEEGNPTTDEGKRMLARLEGDRAQEDAERKADENWACWEAQSEADRWADMDRY